MSTQAVETGRRATVHFTDTCQCGMSRTITKRAHHIICTVVAYPLVSSKFSIYIFNYYSLYIGIYHNFDDKSLVIVQTTIHVKNRLRIQGKKKEGVYWRIYRYLPYRRMHRRAHLHTHTSVRARPLTVSSHGFVLDFIG